MERHTLGQELAALAMAAASIGAPACSLLAWFDGVDWQAGAFGFGDLLLSAAARLSHAFELRR